MILFLIATFFDKIIDDYFQILVQYVMKKEKKCLKTRTVISDLNLIWKLFKMNKLESRTHATNN